MLYLIMGVMGSGKTTVGMALAERLKCPFHDADDLHSEYNKEKMRRGEPLNDEDRKPWLFAVRSIVDMEIGEKRNAVIACSALKEQYRKLLIHDAARIKLIYLKATEEMITSRLVYRKHHFASPAILESQFNALEEPQNAMIIDAGMPVDRIVEEIMEKAYEPEDGTLE
ncbi:MAG: gluconokinase [Spirochaetia bacterium]|nr:gluconokinase [Spirochaetia bacterium]